MGTRERRIREKQQRAEQIKTAAEKVFLKWGYQDATIQRIAREAELSIGTIYFYFKTKEEIYASLNLKYIQACNQGLEKIKDRDDVGVEDKLRQGWKMLLDVFCQSPLSLRALVHGQLQGSLQNISKPLLNELNTTGRQILNGLSAVIEAGMDQGIFRRANPMALADLMWSTFTGVVSWQEAKKTTDPAKKFLDTTLDVAFDVYIRGIRTDTNERCRPAGGE